MSLYTHDSFKHAEDGQVCIWLDGTGWFHPLDAGGEGYDCDRDHHAEPSGIRRDTFAEVSRATNLIADIWEKDGSDPCRVRVLREQANAYRLYAEGLGEPTGSKVDPYLREG